MPRITKPLSSTEVKNAKPKEKEYTLRDGGGLYLRITPTGSRIWLFDYYRPITKKRTNMAFGPYPEVSLAQARQKRDEARALLAQGTDPREWEQQQAEQARAVTEHTFRAVAERWFELKKPSVTANYADDLIRSCSPPRELINGFAGNDKPPLGGFIIFGEMVDLVPVCLNTAQKAFKPQ